MGEARDQYVRRLEEENKDLRQDIDRLLAMVRKVLLTIVPEMKEEIDLAFAGKERPMSKAHRIPLKNGAEQDVLTPWRRVMAWCSRAGVVRKLKARYNRRQRRHFKGKVKEES